MMKKFTQIPLAVQQDIINGKLIGNDLVVYNYLVSKAQHIVRKKTCNKTLTQLKTLVLDHNTMLVKGCKQ